MSPRQRLLFRFSIGLNIFLAVLVAWGHLSLSFVKDQLFLTKVEYNLIELEGLIAKQSNNNWTEPTLVTTELREILNGIWLGNKASESISEEGKITLHLLRNKLSQYPHDENDTKLTEQDKKNFEELRKILRDVGLGLNIQTSENMKPFMNRVTELEKRLKVPLNQNN